MTTTNFEKKLQKLRELYLENHPIDEAEDDVFTPFSQLEKEQRIIASLDECCEKAETLANEITQQEKKDSPSIDIDELKNQLETLQNRKLLLDQKLESLRKGETEIQRRERIKRQLLDLELKRAKLLLGQKDCSKIDQKIKQKAKLFKGEK